MILSVISISHHASTLSQRSPFQLQRDELEIAVREFRRITGSEEAVVLATCNRVEFYRAHPTRANWLMDVELFYHAWGVDREAISRLSSISETRIGAAAARHLFRVASGMDSLVLGEQQIGGQVRAAYSAACRAGGPGRVLHKLFHHAFRVSKRVRTETGLCSGVCSVPGAAVEMLLEGLNTQRIRAMVVGANETTGVVLNHLKRHAVATTLINRTREHAESLAAETCMTGEAADGSPLLYVADWDELQRELSRADLVFTATSSKTPVITRDQLQLRGAGRRWKNAGEDIRLRIADLAVPRDCELQVMTVPGVEVIDLDTLKHRLKRVIEHRYAYLPAAQDLVEQQVDAFLKWLHAQLFAGGIQRVKAELHTAADEEMRRFSSAFHASEAKALDAFRSAMIKRFLKTATEHFEPLGTAMLADPPLVRFDPAALELVLPGQEEDDRPVDPDDPTTRLSCRDLRQKQSSNVGDVAHCDGNGHSCEKGNQPSRATQAGIGPDSSEPPIQDGDTFTDSRATDAS